MKSQTRIFRGQSSTPGTAIGRIYVARTRTDIMACPEGSILVVKTATPEIVLAFGNMVGLVAESGGIASHAAILAREFGLPCVIGAGGVFDEDIAGREAVLMASEGFLELR